MMSETTVKSTISVDANAVKKTPAARNDKQLPDIDFDRFKTSRSFAASRKRKDVFMKGLICLAFIIACIPLISVLWTTIANGIKRLNLNFLSYNMSGVVGGRRPPADTAACCTPSSVRWRSPWVPWSSPCRSV